MKNNWLFIHGGWGGSWQWTPLRDYLREQNILSHAPMMPGMGETGGPHITLDTFIDHALRIIKMETEAVNIAAFSFGGLTATALAERIPEKINSMIFIDAFVPEPGQSFSDIAGEKITRQIKAYTDVMGEKEMIPPFFETDPRYCSHPLQTLFTPVEYSENKLRQLDPTYIECTCKDPRWTFTPLLEDTARRIEKRNWKFHTIKSDHMPMYSHTVELCKLLF